MLDQLLVFVSIVNLVMGCSSLLSQLDDSLNSSCHEIVIDSISSGITINLSLRAR